MDGWKDGGPDCVSGPEPQHHHLLLLQLQGLRVLTGLDPSGGSGLIKNETETKKIPERKAELHL